MSTQNNNPNPGSSSQRPSWMNDPDLSTPSPSSQTPGPAMPPPASGLPGTGPQVTSPSNPAVSTLPVTPTTSTLAGAVHPTPSPATSSQSQFVFKKAPVRHGNASDDGMTRYLCASAYLSSTFRSAFLGHLRKQHCALGRTRGIDIHRVAEHCIEAERRDLFGNIWLTIILILGMLGAAIGGPVFMSITFFVAFVLVLYRSWHRDFTTVANQFNKTKYQSQQQRKDLPRDLEESIRHAEMEQKGDIIVYSGYTPFVGYGKILDGWSLSINITKGAEILGQTHTTHTPASFQEDDLYDKFQHAFSSLQIPNMTQEDIVFVSGTAIRGDQSILPDILGRPVTNITSALASSNDQARSYKAVNISAWDGQLIVSLLYRVCFAGDSLFVEVNRRALLPIATEYKRVDSIVLQPRLRQRLQYLAVALVQAPFLLVFSPLILFSIMSTAMQSSREKRELREAVMDNPLHDYGALTSLRELFSGDYSEYFQILDKEMYSKIVDREFIDCLIGFLDDHKVDTSSVKERTTAVLNNGIFVSGGNVTATNLAAGNNAIAGTIQSLQSTFTKGRDQS